VRHADPERGVVVSRPVTIGNLDRRKVTIEERAAAYLFERVMAQLDAAVGLLGGFVASIRHA